MGLFFEWKPRGHVEDLPKNVRSHPNWYGYRLDDNYDPREEVLDIEATIKKWFFK